jgi:general secretion pathway protein J
MKVASVERGFTLVEMLVALLIFAVLAAAGVALLRSSVSTQQAVGEALADLGEAARLRLLLSSDLSQAVVRPVAGAPGGLAGDASSLTLARAYEPAERRSGEAGLQALRWSLDGDRLVRTSLGPEGGPAAPPTVLARDLQGLAFRYRDRRGAWLGAWAPAAGADPLPAAVELRLTGRERAPLTLVVALSEGPAPPTQAPADGEVR